MDISAIFKAVLAPDQESGLERFEGLRPGDQLTAKILHVETDGRLLIDLGWFRALAQTNIQAKPGQTLNLTVEKIGTPLHLRLEPAASSQEAKPIPQIALSSLLTSAQQQKAVNAIQRLLTTLPDHVKMPEPPVIQHQGGIPQKELTVKPQGEAAQKSSTPQIRHEVGRAPTGPATPVAEAPSLSSNSIAGAGKIQMSVHQALVQLGAFLDKPNSEATVHQWMEALRVQLSESGHLFEARLAEMADPSSPSNMQADAGELQRLVGRDLKPNLMILREVFVDTNANALSESGAGPKDIAILRQTVDRLLSHIEKQQERAVQRAGDQDPYQVFAHLLQVKEQTQPVRLKVYYPRKGRGAERNLQHRIALLLDMDHLGPVRADVAMAGNMLSIRFFVRDEEVQVLFDQHVPEVEAVLSDPFERVDIVTAVSKEKIAQFDREDRMGPPVGRIDVHA